MIFTVQLRRALTQVPVISPCLRAVHRAFVPAKPFTSSDSYWKSRYQRRANSGAGSYGRLADFKTRVLNEFVATNGVGSVIEWGCGDGNQLLAMSYPTYIGVDISAHALAMCRERFDADPTKCFMLTAEAEQMRVQADLALSLDVIYHLTEAETFDSYMRALVASATRFLGIYSSDRDEPGHVSHIRHHSYSAWLAKHAPQWQRAQFVPNPYPFDPGNPDQTSWADFEFFKR